MGEAYRVVPFGQMRLDRYDTVDDFLARAGDFLVAREAEHNLMLGVCTNLRFVPPPDPDDPPSFVTVTDGDAVVLASLRTPPYNQVLSETDEPAAVDLLADALTEIALPGVLGPRDAAARFAERWAAATGKRMVIDMRERIFRLSRVIPPRRPASGRWRIAGPDDRTLLATWLAAFAAEATPTQPIRAVDLEVMVDRWIARLGRTLYLWDDGDATVSMVGAGGETPNGIRIGPVYTPPPQRGRGYASALTAAVSQEQLDNGRSFVFLFTDLANPTSNHIYQAIGYEPVTDVDQYRTAADG